MAAGDAAKFFRELGPEFFMSPSSITAAALSDALNASKTKIVRPAEDPPYIEFNSLYVMSEELSVFLPVYEGEMMARLTQLWDAHPYEERRRGKDLHIRIQNPQLILLAATTPSFLNQFLPAGAWDQGFISRVIMIFSGESVQRSIFGGNRNNNQLREALATDLKSISNLYGEIAWSPEAISAIESWYKDPEPKPDHPRLVYYLSRRIANLLKLCMIASVDRGQDYIVSLADFDRALGWLIEAEYFMPDIFKAMNTSGDGQVMTEAWQYIFTVKLKTHKDVAEHVIIHFLQQRLPHYAVLKCLELLEKSNMIKAVAPGPNGRPLYRAMPREEWGSY